MNRRRQDALEEPSEAQLLVLGLVRRIPTGRVCTYGRLAEAAGFPRRWRWVGRILRESSLAEAVPWHRVVSASGHISERSGSGSSEQRRRLAAEGVEFDDRGRIDLDRFLWQPRTS